tara:strand:+ start:235 stop:468 length:234 start_codon:yes stop_codon:yes gene_type:complete
MNKKQFSKTKSTKRFDFSVSRNMTSHKAGANTVTIQSKDYDVSSGQYSFGASDAPHSFTMSVKEAKALNKFLTETLS